MSEPIREKLASLDEFTHEIYMMTDSQYITSALSAITHFRIPEKLMQNPKTTQELSTEHSIIPDKLFRMLRLLASQGVFSYDPDTDKWSNTELSLLLTMDAHGANALIESIPAFSHALMLFLHSLSSEKTSFELTHGKTWVEYMEDHPEYKSIFIKFLDSCYSDQRKYLRGLLHFESSSRILDIGGGYGAYLCDILNENPEATGSVLDLPLMKNNFLSKIQDYDFSDRIDFISEDFMQTIPQGYNTHLIKFVLHDWDDENALKILTKSRNSISENGKLIIIEYVIDEEDTSHMSALLFDLYMLSYTNGFERTELEWTRLLEKAHYRLVQRIIVEDKLNVLMCEAV